MSLRVLIAAAERAFRESEDGLTLPELAARIGTRWPDRVYRAMVRDGWTFGEQAGRLWLAGAPGVERTSSNPPDQPANTLTSGVAATDVLSHVGSKAAVVSGEPGPITRGSAAGSLSAGRLFDVEPERTGHYEENVAA